MSISEQILLLVNRQNGPAVVLFFSASNILHESTDTYMGPVCCRQSRGGLQQAGKAAGHDEIEGRGRPAGSPAAASVPAARGGSPEDEGQWPCTPRGHLPSEDEGHRAQCQGGRRAHHGDALAQAPQIEVKGSACSSAVAEEAQCGWGSPIPVEQTLDCL